MRVLTFNTWGEYGPPERRPVLLEAVRALDADLLCLQEVVSPDLLNSLDYPTRFHSPESGLAVLSRSPARVQRVLTYAAVSALEPYRRQLLLVQLEWGRLRIWVGVTHLAWKADDEPARLAQVQELVQVAGSLEPPILLAGDFNAEPQSAPIRGIRSAGFTDVYAELHPGEGGITWDNANPFIQSHSIRFPDRRIDYLFLKGAPAGRPRPLSCEVVFRQPDEGGFHPSDHYGVLAVLQP